MTNQDDRLKEINERIDVLKTEIKYYRKSINHLTACVIYQRKIDKAPHAPRIIKYSCIPRSERLFQWTLNNISVQMQLLEVELKTLIKYSE